MRRGLAALAALALLVSAGCGSTGRPPPHAGGPLAWSRVPDVRPLAGNPPGYEVMGTAVNQTGSPVSLDPPRLRLLDAQGKSLAITSASVGGRRQTFDLESGKSAEIVVRAKHSAAAGKPQRIDYGEGTLPIAP